MIMEASTTLRNNHKHESTHDLCFEISCTIFQVELKALIFKLKAYMLA